VSTLATQGRPNNKASSHSVRALGSYSLFGFFNDKTQSVFLRLTSDPTLQERIWKNSAYKSNNGLQHFEFSQDAQNFELDMVNEGFIREIPWKDSFLPIFKFKYPKPKGKDPGTWSRGLLDLVLDSHQRIRLWDEKLSKATNTDNDVHSLILFLYALSKIPKELFEIGEREIYVSLHKCGIANCGIRMPSPYDKEGSEKFENVASKLYKMAAHLQEDPLQNFQADFKKKDDDGREELDVSKVQIFLKILFGESSLASEGLIEAFREVLRSSFRHYNKKSPRLMASYFQALCIAVIHRFLFEQLSRVPDTWTPDSEEDRPEWAEIVSGIGTRGKGADAKIDLSALLADPWALSSQVKDSHAEGLPPLRHVTFMYQILHVLPEKPEKGNRKKDFLKLHAKALLTLGHNVGWKSEESGDSYFPPFNTRYGRLLHTEDLSLLESSICLIFPQALVVVYPPNCIVYLGGRHADGKDHYSPVTIFYEQYWRMIFRLCVRIVEARVVLGMINWYLCDCHRTFLEVRANERKMEKRKKWSLFSSRRQSIRESVSYDRDREAVCDQLVQIGWLLQRVSETLITPEISRFSFVRHKLTEFMKRVHLHEHLAHLETEFQNLNVWVNDESTAKGTRGALRISENTLWIAQIALVVTIVIGIATTVVGILQWRSSGENHQNELEKLNGSVNELKGAVDGLSTTITMSKTEMGQVRNRLEQLSSEVSMIKSALQGSSRREQNPEGPKKETSKKKDLEKNGR